MARDLPLLMASWLNAPLAVHPRMAHVAAAVFSGRINIDKVRTEMGELGRLELEAIAGGARLDADAKRAEHKTGTILEAVDDIAVIQVYGALCRTWGVGPYSGATGYDGILMQLEDALTNPSIKGIWLDIDSGGGAVNGMFDLADTIFLYRSRNKDGPNKKPIWAMAADYAYSAAFLVGTSADRFFCGPSGGVGSVGIITNHTSYRKANENDGIIVNVLRYPPLKALSTEFEDLDQQTYDHIMEQIREITEIFQAKIARNMNIAKSAVAGTKGLDYMGRHAKAIGFVSDVLPEPIVWENFRRLVSGR